MTEQPNREVAVLNAALELRPAERAAYLDQACAGDAALRQQVGALLGRAHFFAAAAEAMRRILIERARRKRAVRHGGDQQRVDIQEVDLAASADDDQLLAVNEALDKLAVQHKVEAELVKLRYFVGMTNEEAADVLGISPRTAKYYWTHARAWLFNAIKSEAS